jgi:immune inhibitor A
VSLSPDARARLAKLGRAQTEAFTERELAARGINVPNPRTAFHLGRYPAGRTVHGTALVLLVDFPDKPALTSPAHFDSLLFARNYGTGSLRDYYLEVSGGRLDVSTGRVIGWLRMPETYAYYVDGQRGFGLYPHNAQRLAEDALAAARDSLNLADYDNDGPDGIPRSGGSADDDGLVDGIFIVHAGTGFETSIDPNDIHSHEWGVKHPVVYDSTTAWLYSMEPEDGTVGVFCHEYGHVLGLPDLYDLGDLYGPVGVGDWSLMGTGSWRYRFQLGDTPTHLDAWCKAQLGFVEPIDVHETLPRERVTPVETGGSVYRLSTHGEPRPEYFLLENRQAIGFDQTLPGTGILVYHVDETVPTNADWRHYKVAVVQADGLMQLEGKNFGSRGDPGDPFPGIRGLQTFGPETTPSSDLYFLGPSQVGFSILFQDQLSFLLKLFTSRYSHFFVASAEPVWSVTADGGVRASHLDLHLVNDGLTPDSVIVQITSLDPLVSTEGDGTTVLPSYGMSLVAGDVSVPLGMASALPRDPYEAAFRVAFTASDGAIEADTIRVAFGRRRGLDGRYANEADALAAGWTHGTLGRNRAPGADAWHLVPDVLGDPRSAPLVWSTTLNGDSTLQNLDAALVTPPFLAGVGSVLTFRHRMDADVFTHRVGFDGGVIDLSVNGGPWRRVAPEGGYPYVLHIYGQNDLSGQEGFSGHMRAWEDVRVPLAPVLEGRLASVRVRFRFATGHTNRGSGWWIDGVRVSAGQMPGLALQATRSARGVVLAWNPEETPRALSLYRARNSGTGAFRVFEPLATFAQDAAARAIYEDTGARSDVAYTYRLTARGAFGDSILGEVTVGDADDLLRVDAGPNPGRWPLLLRIGTHAAQQVAVRVYDLGGRLVATVFDGRLAAGESHVYWERRVAHGAMLRPGMYLIEVAGGGRRYVQKVVMLGAR